MQWETRQRVSLAKRVGTTHAQLACGEGENQKPGTTIKAQGTTEGKKMLG